MPSERATKKTVKKAQPDSGVAPVRTAKKKPLIAKAAQKAAKKATAGVGKVVKKIQTKKVVLGKARPADSAPTRLRATDPASGLGIFDPAALKRALSRLDDELPSKSASWAAALVELGQASPSSVRKTPVAVSAERQEVGLFLVRPAASSAAQALSSYPVELNAESRKKQIDRLREFRNDTKAQAADVERWLLDHSRKLGAARSNGLISAGRVLPLTPEEAGELRRDVRGVQVIENRVLSIITPTRVTLAAGGASEAACWHLEAIGQRTARRDGRALSGRGVHVAVLDTGVQLDHPELAGRVVEGWKIDPRILAVDASAVVRDPQHGDTDGHGTHVAGLICGTTVGVAPGAQATSVLMMPRGYATTFDFIRCLDWAAEQPEIALVNFSAGEFPFNDDMMPLVDDLIRTGVLPFFAVGNEGQNKTRSPGNYIDGISVGAVDPPHGGKVSAFSGSGQMSYNHTSYEVPDLVAPGGSIHSSYRGGRYAELDGTSMAAPIACGVAACFLEQAGGALRPAQLSDLLYRSCTLLAGELPIRQGRGLVQVPLR